MKICKLLLLLALVPSTILLAQDVGIDLERARLLGKEAATKARDEAANQSVQPDAPSVVPNYQGSDLPEADLIDNPDFLNSKGRAAASNSDGFKTVMDPSRPYFDPNDIDLSAAQTIADNPGPYAGGTQTSGSSGDCKPLPNSDLGGGYYYETCNAGAKVIEESRICSVPLRIEVEGEDYWQYQCDTEYQRGRGNRGQLCFRFQNSLDNGICRVKDRRRVGQLCLQYGRYGCVEPGDPIYALTLACSQQVAGVAGGTLVHDKKIKSEERDEGACNAATGNDQCTLTSETCSDSSPQTRTINGLEVTRSCWNWERSYQCTSLAPANDCAPIEAKQTCSFDHEKCLDDNCSVKERVYKCSLSTLGGNADTPKYVCSDDIYCIDGNCETIEREASTEFNDALVALNSLGQARDEFNENDFTVFKGSRATCHKKIFGAINCCAGKSILPGGLALCSKEEKQLDERDRKGLCSYVGSYCSKKILGVCVTKKKAYCCFESKLTRIIQEQGRKQLGRPWGDPKKEQCAGFTIQEFQRLDLSKMDFSEVYTDFLEAAKLPNEIDATIQIQQRIQQYYQAHTGGA